MLDIIKIVNLKTGETFRYQGVLHSIQGISYSDYKPGVWVTTIAGNQNVLSWDTVVEKSNISLSYFYQLMCKQNKEPQPIRDVWDNKTQEQAVRNGYFKDDLIVQTKCKKNTNQKV